MGESQKGFAQQQVSTQERDKLANEQSSKDNKPIQQQKNKPKDGSSPFPFSFLLPLLIPLIFLFFSAALQTDQILSRANQVPVERTAQISNVNDGILFLHVIYPPKIDISGVSTAKAPISLWLSYATNVSVNSTPTPDQQAKLTLQAPIPTATENITNTVSTPTPTATSTPYVFALNATPNVLTFFDKEGQPIPPHVALTPSKFGVTPVVMFLQINPNDNKGEALALIPSLREESGYKDLPPISIQYDTQFTTKLKLFLSFVLAPTAIGSLLIAIATFAIQQLTKLQDERQAKKKTDDDEEKKREDQAKNLATLIKTNAAEGARQYLDIRKAISNTESLDVVWNNVSSELETLTELERVSKSPEFKRVVSELSKEKVEQAIKFALQHKLDEDWESRAAAILQEILRSNLLSIDTQLLLLAEHRTREALVRIWPNISYWRLLSPNRDASIQDKWKYYEETRYPFGAPHAEENTWLFDGRFDGRYGDQRELWGIERTDSVIISGACGWGKTTTALWLMDDMLRSKAAFPVYIPTTINISLLDLAPIFARTLLYYLAINPSAFLKRGMAGRASIAHLFIEYLGKDINLTLLLRKAGLPQTGAGLEMEQEIQRLTKDYQPKSPLSEQDILALLSESYPDGFNTTWLLMDIQDQLVSEKDLERFFELLKNLNCIGLKTKVFLSNINDCLMNLQAAPIPVRILKWGQDDLRGLIAVRLERLGEVGLSGLCKREVLELSKTPEERLSAAAQGQPGILVQKGNELLKRISQKQDLLSKNDLNEILGPIRKRSSR